MRTIVAFQCVVKTIAISVGEAVVVIEVFVVIGLIIISATALAILLQY